MVDPEDMQNQLEEQEGQIEALQKTVGCLIVWQGKEFGEAGVKQLLNMLGIDDVTDESIKEILTGADAS